MRVLKLQKKTEKEFGLNSWGLWCVSCGFLMFKIHFSLFFYYCIFYSLSSFCFFQYIFFKFLFVVLPCK